MSSNYKDKVVLVTGASRGIGRAVAEQFAEEGAKVVVNYAGNREDAKDVVSGIQARGGEAVAIRADISRVAEVERLFSEALAAFGRLDVLVNNAGIMITKPIGEFTEEEFDRMFAVNVKGTFFAIQQAALHLSPGGSIVNFSTSVAGMMFPAYSAYAGTKGAVEQFTRQLAKELGPKGITINAVAPGPVNTELFMNGKSEAQLEAIAGMNAFHRLGETGDVTGAVLFLAGEEARWITGQTIRVNGGFA